MSDNTQFILSPEQLKKAQNRMLSMLLYFQSFCDEHGLLFYLHGGAAIGAIREHGFVPWDDDIDVLMPRPDYERFCQLWDEFGNKDRYVLCRTNEKINYHHPCASLRDPNTTFICNYNQNIEMCHGIAIEFGPLDGCPKSRIAHLRQLFNAFLFVLFNTQRLPNNKGGVIRKLSWLAYKIFRSDTTRYKIWSHAERQISRYSWNDCDHVAELRGTIKYMFNEYPKEWFDHAVYFDFEGYKVPVMAGYDGYLRGIFGDYMKRPPAPEQIAKHDIVYADMDHPYTDYRGIYYFPGTEKTGGAM